MAKKIVTPANQEKQGNLEEALSRSEQFFENNKKTLLGASIVVIVAVLGIVFYNIKIVAPRELKASEALFPGESYFLNGDFETALKGNNYDFVGFEQIADEYSCTKAGNLAKAYAGLCCAQLDSFEVAISYLEKFKGKDKMVGPSVTGALANSYASLDQLDKAASTFEKAAKQADNRLLTPYYLFQAGLIYESMGKDAKALALYNRVKVEFPSSNEAADIEKYIIRINSK